MTNLIAEKYTKFRYETFGLFIAHEMNITKVFVFPSKLDTT